MATNWICNYAVVQATLPGVQNLQYKFWIVWGVSDIVVPLICNQLTRIQVICAAFIPITYLFYPEVCTRITQPFPSKLAYRLLPDGKSKS